MCWVGAGECVRKVKRVDGSEAGDKCEGWGGRGGGGVKVQTVGFVGKCRG